MAKRKEDLNEPAGESFSAVAETSHPPNCMCVACIEVAAAATRAPVFQSVSASSGVRSNGHTVQCVCVDCAQLVQNAAVVQ